MAPTNKQPDIASAPSNEQTTRRSLPARLLAGALMVGAAVGLTEFSSSDTSDAYGAPQTTLSQPVNEAIASSGIESSHALNNGLRSTNELPGLSEKISQEQISTLENSLVTILVEPNGGSSWTQHCSGLKVTIDGSDYVQTAAHCFEPYNGLLPSGSKAGNILPVTSYTYAIGLPANQKELAPIAEVTAVAIDVGGNDTALLQLSAEVPEFQNIPAVPIETVAAISPTPGEQVAMVGVPESDYDNPVIGEGTYIGQVQDPNNSTQKIDVIGLNAASSTQDACYFGASGSSAIFADGHISGPMTVRSGRGEQEDLTLKSDDPVLAANLRSQLQQATGYNLGSFNVLCGYVVPPTYNLLISGLNNPVNPAP